MISRFLQPPPPSGRHCDFDGVETGVLEQYARIPLDLSNTTLDDRSIFRADAGLGNCFLNDHQLPV